MNEHTIWYIHPYAGGPGVGRYDRPYHLAKHWEKLGSSSVVITPDHHHLLDKPHKSGVENIAGVSYRFLKAPVYKGNGVGRIFNMFSFTLQLLLQCPSIARDHGRPSMVISSSPHPYAFLASRIIALRYKAISVFEVRDLWPLSLVELAGVSPKHPLVRFTGWLEKYAYRKADFVVSLLPCTFGYMQPLGVTEDRWRYIPNGIESDPVADDLVSEQCIDLARKWRCDGRVVIVYTGALGRPNHVETLLYAMKHLSKSGSRLAAIIVGRGELKEDLVNLVTELGVESCVSLFDQIPKRSVQALLKFVDAGYISLRPEPIFRFGVSPNKIFDYMLASLPIISAINAGNDLVVDAGCGYSVDPGDALSIANVLAKLESLSDTQRRKLGENGFRFVTRNHSYRNLANKYIELLKPI